MYNALKYREIAVPSLRPELLVNVAFEIVYDPVVVNQRVIDVEQEYNIMVRFYHIASSRYNRDTRKQVF